ncbi:PTS sugar transporter subunit IIA [Bifidobacterium leontopitheci]|uniref:PTS N-acetylglucosamine transporter subunit IIABC n=1 Tax=Bifidobacterium leontopitheci TaxID=2650774 RepID=A0A6I1GNG8_9BIFI|nr:PTS glucose transporter subunit IIA [Bifidobacterium leontopitheci]KAB7791086.1 PTS N-acetylglucosamine transporter subunit IIABC [Bifidobacterium leontopitheci]
MTAAPVAAAPKSTPKVADNAILAPVDGAIKPISEVPDETFASKILGDGFAVVPTSGLVTAPVSGKITTVADAKHAVGITTPSGVEVLVHIGVDTVQLHGAPFTMHVAQGQAVNAGDPLVDVDWAAIKAAGKPTDVIVVFTNPALIDNLSITATGAVATGAQVGTMTTK